METEREEGDRNWRKRGQKNTTVTAVHTPAGEMKKCLVTQIACPEGRLYSTREQLVETKKQ